jgi:2-succinyl-6-hydroxy-2,4-cyclohexadiene-1-carboxylate synthase
MDPGGAVFEVRGSGPPALLVHGFTGSASAWPPQLRSGLERVLRVIAVDLPGHGAAAPRTAPEAWAFERVVDELCAVLDACGAERALWIGYSMGGRLALGAAALRPERVAALVLEGASPGLNAEAERAERRQSDEALARRIERDGLESFVAHWLAQPLFATQRALGPERLEAERRRRLRCDAASLAACLRGLGAGAQPPFWDALAKLHVPALLLAGALDAKFCAIARAMAERMPDARVRELAGCGHAAHLEDPEAWLRAVLRFAGQVRAQLRKLGGAGGPGAAERAASQG